MLQRCSYWFWLSFIFNYYDRETVESCACRRMSDSALCLWKACLWLVTLEMDVRYTLHVSYIFFSSFPSILFPFSHAPLFLTFFIFHFNVSFLASFISFPLSNALLQFSLSHPSLLCCHPPFTYHQIGFFAWATSVQTLPELLFSQLPLERLHCALCRWGFEPENLVSPRCKVTCSTGCAGHGSRVASTALYAL